MNKKDYVYGAVLATLMIATGIKPSYAAGVEIQDGLIVINHSDEMTRWEIHEMAYTLWCEARGEPKQGVYFIADVIRNRVKDPRFPDSYFGVIHQAKQFSCWGADGYTAIHSYKMNEVPLKDQLFYYRVAYRVVTGKLPKMTFDSKWYHAKRVSPKWRHKLYKLATVGNHVFYTDRR